jgi:hypothetical protein
MRDEVEYASPFRYFEFGSCLAKRQPVPGVKGRADRINTYGYVVWLLQLAQVVEDHQDATEVVVVFHKHGGLELDLACKDNEDRCSFRVDNSADPVDWRGSPVVQREPWRAWLNKKRKKLQGKLAMNEYEEYHAERLPFVAA